MDALFSLASKTVTPGMFEAEQAICQVMSNIGFLLSYTTLGIGFFAFILSLPIIALVLYSSKSYETKKMTKLAGFAAAAIFALTLLTIATVWAMTIFFAPQCFF